MFAFIFMPNLKRADPENEQYEYEGAQQPQGRQSTCSGERMGSLFYQLYQRKTGRLCSVAFLLFGAHHSRRDGAV